MGGIISFFETTQCDLLQMTVIDQVVVQNPYSAPILLPYKLSGPFDPGFSYVACLAGGMLAGGMQAEASGDALVLPLWPSPA